MNDLFISHASEDKDELVRPLATMLQKLGVSVWYDEYSIGVGESIVASIDKGLIECRFGLVVISPAFLQKSWTDYELKSLMSKEVSTGNKVIPIWHNVDRETVANRSLYLADKKALLSSVGTKKLAGEIIKVVRPDIINSFASKTVARELKLNAGNKDRVELEKIKLNKIMHKRLPPHVIETTKVIHSALPLGMEFSEFLDGFKRDLDYDGEVLVWSAMASAFIETLCKMISNDLSGKLKEMWGYLLSLSIEAEDESDIEAEIKECLLDSYYENLKTLVTMINEGNENS